MIETVAGVLASVAVLAAAAWTAGAVYYDAFGMRWWGRVIALLWIAAVVAGLLFWRPLWHPVAAALAVFAGVLAWWWQLSPRSDRPWRPELAVTASAEIDGDRVRVQNVRHAEYRTLDDVTPRYDDRSVALSRLRGMDLLISSWGSAVMCHPFAIFEFDAAPGERGPIRVAFSLEVRGLRGQGFSLYRNLYRQNELICVTADERDLMRRRVFHEPDRRLHLYRLRLRPGTVRARFLEYIDLINALDARPEWYNALATNCTTAIVRRYRTARPPLDWRVLVNGRMGEWLYERGWIESAGLDFDELRERSLIDERVRSAPPDADGPAFGAWVRAGLPGFPGVAPPRWPAGGQGA